MPIIQTAKTLAARNPYDFYATPMPHARAGISLLPPGFQPEYILDPGMGTGVWGIAARDCYPDAVIVGTDIRPVSRPAAYTFMYTGGYNFLSNREREIFDLVMGNPPYGKNGTTKDRLAAERFVRRALWLLVTGGWLVFLLPLGFLAGQNRAKGLYLEHPPRRIVICSERPSFTGNDRTDATDYAFYCWQKGYSGKPELDWILPSDFADQSHQYRLPGGF